MFLLGSDGCANFFKEFKMSAARHGLLVLQINNGRKAFTPLLLFIPSVCLFLTTALKVRRQSPSMDALMAPSPGEL